MTGAAAATAWSARSRTPRKRGSKKPIRPPLVEIPADYIRPVEEVMAALTVDGQRSFKEDLHRAVESPATGPELAYTVVAWTVSKYLIEDPSFHEALAKLPQLAKSENITSEELAKRIGL